MTRIANRDLRVSSLPVNGAHLDLCCPLSANGKKGCLKTCCKHNQYVFRGYFHICDAITGCHNGKCALTVDRADDVDAGILLASC